MSFAGVNLKDEAFAGMQISAIAQKLQTDVKKGLSGAEAKKRLETLGPNELEKEDPTPLWRMVVDQFLDLIVGLLCAAAAVSLALGEIVEGLAIVAIVTINAVIGVVQEAKAEAALDALKSMATNKAIVIRDGVELKIESAEVVQGDLVLLETGASLPADVRLIDTQDLQCREMALTGESEPVNKLATWLLTEAEANKTGDEKKLTPTNMAFMGCEVSDGRGMGIVIGTGMKTRMGAIAKDLNSADSGPSPLQERLEHLGHQLGIGAIALCSIVFVVGLYLGHTGSEGHHSDQPLWLQMLLTSVSLAVAAVPEGLPAAVTITLALGMRDMVKRNALIRNLHSVETLGCTNVICTDKTGTLTKGEMTAVRLYAAGCTYQISGTGFDPVGTLTPEKASANSAENAKFPLLLSLLCSNASLYLDEETKKWKVIGNASECPLVVAAAKAGVQKADTNANFSRVRENPFNSERKMMSTLSEIVGKAPAQLTGSSHVAVVKGAPNMVLQQCTEVINAQGQPEKLTAAARAKLLQIVDAYSGEALRVLAIAYKPYAGKGKNGAPSKENAVAATLETDLVLAGLIASIDPEREEVPGAIRSAHQAGIRVVMITGDYLLTARAIAVNIGLVQKDAPEAKAVDCAEIRSFGQLVRDAEASGDKAAQEAAEAKIDALTSVCDVYARAKPEDKITIVKSLQRQGNICSMTGDGVNDAPALKQADIGVAMGITGTDVAKAAAAMVLTDDNFCSIVGAIEQGRIIYSNIQKFVFFLLSCNISEILIIFFCICAGLASPLDPIQLLWMNLVTDGAPALALAMEPGNSSVLQEAPRPKSEPIVDRIMFVGIIIQSVVTTAVTLTAYYIGLLWHTQGVVGGIYTRDEKALMAARTMAFVTLSLCEVLRAYTVRHARKSIFQIGVFGNSAMQYAVGGSAALVFLVAVPPAFLDFLHLQEIFNCTDLSRAEWMVVALLTAAPAVVEELTKAYYRATGYGLRQQKVYVVEKASTGKKRN